MVPSRRLLLTVVGTVAPLVVFGSAAQAQRVGSFDGSTPRITSLDLPGGGASDGRQLVVRRDSGSHAGGGDSPLPTKLSTVNVVTGKATPLAIPSERCEGIGGDAGRLLLQCDQTAAGGARLYLGGLDGQPWRLLAIPDDQLRAAEPRFSIVGVGKHWFQAVVDRPAGHFVTKYFARADGRVISDDRIGRRHIADLGRRDLSAPLCTPLRRAARPASKFERRDSDRYALQYDGSWAVNIAPGADGRKLLLRHCGSAHAKTLCRGSCSSVDLGRGQLVWNNGPRTYYRDLRAGRTTRVRISGSAHRHLGLIGRHVLAYRQNGAISDVGLVHIGIDR